MAEVRALCAEGDRASIRATPAPTWTLPGRTSPRRSTAYSDDPARLARAVPRRGREDGGARPDGSLARPGASRVCPTSSAASGRAVKRRGNARWRWHPTIPAFSGWSGTNMPYGIGTERATEGVELIKRARRLNPLMPAWQTTQLGPAPRTSRASTSRRSRRLRRAATPSLETKVFKALAYAQLGRDADAAREAEAILKEKPDFTARGWHRQRHHGARRQLGGAVPRRRAQGRPADRPAGADELKAIPRRRAPP